MNRDRYAIYPLGYPDEVSLFCLFCSRHVLLTERLTLDEMIEAMTEHDTIHAPDPNPFPKFHLFKRSPNKQRKST